MRLLRGIAAQCALVPEQHGRSQLTWHRPPGAKTLNCFDVLFRSNRVNYGYRGPGNNGPNVFQDNTWTFSKWVRHCECFMRSVRKELAHQIIESEFGLRFSNTVSYRSRGSCRSDVRACAMAPRSQSDKLNKTRKKKREKTENSSSRYLDQFISG